ncbi:hypothetical protein ACIQMR_15175 [Streptomyces sp. NPDC091376]|uniref:hypothetical protein n=1 Tax=Streptomyces sp. NPDC091376 TaxID=3365994 RepID=UPI0037F9AABE
MTETTEEAAPSLAPVPGSTAPLWQDGLPVTLLAPAYRLDGHRWLADERRTRR